MTPDDLAMTVIHMANEARKADMRAEGLAHEVARLKAEVARLQALLPKDNDAPQDPAS